MSLEAGEFAIVDNSGFVETGFSNSGKALSGLKKIKKDADNGKLALGGRVTIMKVLGTYDNYLAGNPEYLGADGLPIPD